MNTADQFEVDYDGLHAMCRKMYWGQIFNRKTSWEVKKLAVKCLFAMWRFK